LLCFGRLLENRGDLLVAVSTFFGHADAEGG